MKDRSGYALVLNLPFLFFWVCYLQKTWTFCVSIRASDSVLLNFMFILYEKTYFFLFYFTLSLLQNIHISLSILQDISIKYSFFSIFYYFSQLPFTYIRALSLSLSTHFFWTDHLSLSLSLSLLPSLILSQKLQPKSLLHWVLSSSVDPRTKLHDPDPFFTARSTNQAPVTQIPSSSVDPRTKLHDLDPFFTGRSTNQAPRPRSLLHRPIHEPSSTGTDLSLCWFVCVGLFMCGCVSVLIFPCGCVCF